MEEQTKQAAATEALKNLRKGEAKIKLILASVFWFFLGLYFGILLF